MSTTPSSQPSALLRRFIRWRSDLTPPTSSALSSMLSRASTGVSVESHSTVTWETTMDWEPVLLPLVGSVSPRFRLAAFASRPPTNPPFYRWRGVLYLSQICPFPHQECWCGDRKLSEFTYRLPTLLVPCSSPCRLGSYVLLVVLRVLYLVHPVTPPCRWPPLSGKRC